MPFILQNGELVEVTDAQFEAFGGGEAQVRRTTAAERRALAAQEAVAAGGQNIQVTDPTNAANNQQIINPNTTNNSPGQTLTPVSAPLNTTANTATDVPPIPGAPTAAGGFRRAAQEVQPTQEELNAAGITNIPDNTPVRATQTSDITDFTFEDNASLGYSEIPPDPEGGGIGIDYTNDFTDTGISPYGEENDPTDIPESEIDFAPQDIDPELSPYGEQNDEFISPDEVQFEPADLDPNLSPYGEENDPLDVPTDQVFANVEDAALDSINQQAALERARLQAAVKAQSNFQNTGDWRFRIQLARSANYLYNAEDPGILAPLSTLQGTDGVIFPYTPRVDIQYRANYQTYDLTHSNYRGYFYQNSYIDAINVQATFTAQDTKEAEYLLAVIHFFRSVTKMFYGQDPLRGAPPPLVYVTGFGEYQFNRHPCVVSQFNYNLPADVNYIRARSRNINGTNLVTKRDRTSVPTDSLSSTLNRLFGAGLPKGGRNPVIPPPTLGLDSPTYVPTQIDINLVLYPMQSRQQVSNQFDNRNFANGNLLKGGFW